MKSFSIVYTVEDTNWSAFKAISQPAEDNHYWIDAESVIAMSPQARDTKWVAGFWTMLKAVEPYGHSNLEEKLVKAHCLMKE